MRLLLALLSASLLPACLLPPDCPDGWSCPVDYPDDYGSGSGGGGGSAGGDPSPAYLDCDRPIGAALAGIAVGGSLFCSSWDSSGAEVTPGTPFTVDWHGGAVEVHAEAPGATTLRVAWTGYDDVELPLEARPVTSIQLRASGFYRFLDPYHPTAYLADGSSIGVEIALEDATGGRLVDHDLTITVDGVAPPSRFAWDFYHLGALPVGDHVLAIQSGATGDAVLPVPVVDTVDEIAVAASAEQPLPGRPGDVGDVCFHAFNAGRELAAPWQVEASGAARVLPWDPSSSPRNCVRIEATEVGQAEVRATTTGQSTVVTFEVATE